MEKIKILLLGIILFSSCKNEVPAPAPVGPIPTENQIKWQEMEFYGFVHFNINSFTNQEWSYGDQPPELFNPSELDAKQWAKVAKEAGMKGIILTVKHHDGFCLWPSEFTNYSVKNSPWKNGEGDVVKYLAEACEEYGLKMGIYLSPWDRNHADYGRPEYIAYMRNQLTELLTNYGDIFEVWFDGANGGDGYYGGANETRKIDKLNYYDWENTYKIIRELQPGAVIFGHDLRWVGNEHGFAYETTWSPLLKDAPYDEKYSMGHENGTHWVPAESDVSIRPGWFYHESENDKVKSLEHLLNIYYKSVGQNSTLLLNLPVDKRGLVHENDEKQLKKLVAQLKEDFANNLALNKKISATNVRGGVLRFDSGNAIDGKKDTYWATDDNVNKASITIDFGEPKEINRLVIQEYIKLGQRIKKFSVEAEVNGEWLTVDKQTTIGYKRILRFETLKASKLRINIDDAKGCILISNIEIYNAPAVVDAAKIIRNKEGIVSLDVPASDVEVYYTTDGEDPDFESDKYIKPFIVNKPTTIKSFTFDKATNRKSDVVTKNFDISKKNWEVKIANNSGELSAIDDNVFSHYNSKPGNGAKEIVIDLGKTESVYGFSYTPSQDRYPKNIVTHYSFYGSSDAKNWELLSKGEFSNIEANTVLQKIGFKKSFDIRYLKLVADKISNDSKIMTVAEIGVITSK
ncbi:MAG: alpha-L-fucosidase [Bacteroidota bacterium]